MIDPNTQFIPRAEIEYAAFMVGHGQRTSYRMISDTKANWDALSREIEARMAENRANSYY